MRLTISVRSGWPAWTWAILASLMAESTASEPELVKNTRGSVTGAQVARRSASSSAGGLVKGSKQEYASSVRTCRATASAMSARPWPMLQYQRLAMAST